MTDCPKCECHGLDHCPDVDWEAQRRLDANPDLKAILQAAMNGPRVERPRREPRVR